MTYEHSESRQPSDVDERVVGRSHLLPEERAAGSSSDAQAQAREVLRESEEREDEAEADGHNMTEPIERRTSEETADPVPEPDASDTPIPADPEVNPAQTVDALEEKITGRRQDQRREEPEGTVAFEQDIDDPEAVHREQNPARDAPDRIVADEPPS